MYEPPRVLVHARDIQNTCGEINFIRSSRELFPQESSNTDKKSYILRSRLNYLYILWCCEKHKYIMHITHRFPVAYSITEMRDKEQI